jgi:NAD(P)-dependent dehydrogenase (short-subunit alcohol dehydrogenase family)
MLRQGKAVFATLSARVGSIGDNRLGGWYAYRASKAALNQLVRTAAVELARRSPDTICVASHPGTVATVGILGGGEPAHSHHRMVDRHNDCLSSNLNV